MNKLLSACFTYLRLGEILCGIAFCCFKFKRYDFAIAIYEFLSRMDYLDNQSYARFNLGLAYFNAGEYDEARDNFLKFMETYPLSYEVSYNIASTYLRTNDIPMAKKYFERSFELNNDIDSLYQLGLLAFEERDIQAAYSYFSKAKELVPNKIDFEYCLLRCSDLLCQYSSPDEITNILHKYESLLSKKAKLADFYIESAYVYALAKAGKIDAVIAKATGFLSTATNQKHILHKILGLCYLIEQDYKKALNNLTEAETLSPQNDKIKINNLMSYYHQLYGDMKQAEHYRQKAQDSDENIYKEDDLYII